MDVIKKIDTDKEGVINNEDLKNIPDSLIRFTSKITLGNIKNKDDAFNEFTKILERSDVKKLYRKGKNDGNTKKIRGFADYLDYSIFGSYNNYKKELEE